MHVQYYVWLAVRIFSLRFALEVVSCHKDVCVCV
jgi:hypothetical protein